MSAPMPSARTPQRRLATGTVLVALLAAGCGGGDAAEPPPSFPAQVLAALDAVEGELGDGQAYFEVTATPQLTNVFVAVDDATAALPFVYLDGELQPPAPAIGGAVGRTFRADAVDFEPDVVLDQVATELPGSSIDAFSVEGGPDDTVRYVVSVRSEAGGALDVVVAADGSVLSVDPV